MAQKKQSKNVPLLAIVGETASGKSELSLQLAQQLNGEIIAADAMTVYRGFDIGTAKPSEGEQKVVPHHLLDISDASQPFNVAMFKQLACAAIQEISARGKLPVLVGGTGLYIDSILFDYEFRSQPPSGFREKLEKMSLAELVRLAQDKHYDLTNIDTRNRRRLIRLIEADGRSPQKRPARNNTVVVGITLPREKLRARVEARVDTMISRGLADEVKDLSQRYGWGVEPMRSIGYREWQAYFLGQKSLEETREEIIIHTMQLAKKQRTWFRRNEGIHWVNNISEGVEYTTTLMNK